MGPTQQRRRNSSDRVRYGPYKNTKESQPESNASSNSTAKRPGRHAFGRRSRNPNDFSDRLGNCESKNAEKLLPQSHDE